MRRVSSTRGSWLVALGAAALAAVAAGAPRDEVRITAIVSQDAPQYQEALDGFRSHLDRQGVRVRIDTQLLHGEIANAAAALQHARDDHVSLVLALGSIGAQAAVRELHDIPVVAGLVLNAEDLDKPPNAAVVTLEFPVETELAYLKKLLPGQRNVGVLFNPVENQARIDTAV